MIDINKKLQNFLSTLSNKANLKGKRWVVG